MMTAVLTYSWLLAWFYTSTNTEADTVPVQPNPVANDLAYL